MEGTNIALWGDNVQKYGKLFPITPLPLLSESLLPTFIITNQTHYR